ncbi:MAG: hypothetical protein EOR85_19985 [Mesorhizobium sp.]|nr:MAG: hypothetical protein EOR85_19985 [Mesorhizobium sp.]
MVTELVPLPVTSGLLETFREPCRTETVVVNVPPSGSETETPGIAFDTSSSVNCTPAGTVFTGARLVLRSITTGESFSIAEIFRFMLWNS